MPEIQWLKAPVFAKWYVTSRCNLRCRHCYLDDYSQKLPLSRLLRVADELDLPQMLALASALGVQEVKFAAFVPVGSGALSGLDLRLNVDICREISNVLWIASQAYPTLKIDGGPFVKRLSFMPRDRASTSTFGCGAGTTTIVINSDLSVSACDMQTQTDRTTQALGRGATFSDLWLHSPHFARWRGQSGDRAFVGVHQHGCHLAYREYGQDVFIDEKRANDR